MLLRVVVEEDTVFFKVRGVVAAGLLLRALLRVVVFVVDDARAVGADV